MSSPRVKPNAPPAAFRLVLGGLLGVLLAVALPGHWPWEAHALLGWATFCAVNLLRLAPLLRCTPEETRARATREDNTRVISAFLTLAAAVISLVGVVFALHEAGQQKGLAADLLTGLAIVTVVLSWLLVHVEYVLHYARRFYEDGGAGVQFVQRGQDGPLADPTFSDFAYLSFTIGMTFQVSDTNLDTRRMRRLLLGHAMISYLFGTVIIAVTINAVASLVG
ncbi:DUF1345 domain-containing protein [Deinococcus gobiensis]|uniref:DUF1345 domain-containing protein n=1 Tax=Deinococcus gobiensis (strain DSM 21396 / JCM 16679 / CGMCC 1.7299 / I-0) TaxID=745776 RepID=H8GVJ5_DEIGI|nr:DUF1345 domain-containing protein [Deinococcus gobiensis]AFD24372.1 hypothetical protein DGo_CA0445 [Deinococcus gobiensis I-0]